MIRDCLTGILCAAVLAMAQVQVEETVVLPTAAAWGGGDVVGSPLIGRTYNAGGGPGIWITADGGYRLYLNGELLAQDNVAGRVTFVPMTFLPGTNALSVVGVDGNGAPGVLVQIDELEKTLVSGSGWKVSTSVTDNAWKSRSYNDASWAAVTIGGSSATTPSGNALGGFASGSGAKWIWAGSATSSQAVLRYTFKIQAEGFGAATTGGDGGLLVVATDSTSIIKALQDTARKIILVPEGTYDLRRSRNAVTEAKAANRTWCKLPCGSSNPNSSNTYYRVAFEANSCASLGDGSTPVAESENLKAWSNWITTKANKTLIGMGRGANLRGASIYMRANEGAKNQIYRNLGIYDVNPHLVEGGDGLSIVGGSTNRTGKYWADHISYKWISDGLDIEYSTETTISWLDYDGRNEFNCYQLDPFVALVEDADVTYANNYWHATSGRVPKVGSGLTASRVHLYNNYIDTNNYYMIGAEAVNASAPTQVRFENNYVNHATHAYVFQGANGNVWWSGNTTANSTAKFYGENSVVLASAPLETVFTPSYSYAKRAVANLPTENPLNTGAGGRWGKPLVYNQGFGQSNKAPAVALTSPVVGVSLTAPATLTLTATASDADGSVKSVAFFAGTQLLGTATASPWSVSAASIPAGTHSVVAVATDNSGLTRVSDFVTLTVASSAPVFTSGKSLSVSENTVAVVKVVATSPSGKVVSYSIAGGEDSAFFTVGNATGELVFAKAPDFEKPSDNGADNIYKVNVSAADGAGTAKQSIAVLVTDVVETVGMRDGGAGLVRAQVIWMDLKGQLVRQEEQWLDPSSPNPRAPVGIKGVLLAKIRFAGFGTNEITRSVVAPE
ncbi:MAG: hypothetical protein RL318_2415 [Fibrobacterota bacterium]